MHSRPRLLGHPGPARLHGPPCDRTEFPDPGCGTPLALTYLVRPLFLIVSLVPLVLLGALSAPASACPRDRACLAVRLPASAGEVPAHASKQPRRLKAWTPRTTAEPIPSGVVGVAVHRIKPREEHEAAWLWRAIRKQTYKDLPSYEERNQLSFVFSPVMVSTPHTTVPGFGVSGEF